MVMCPVHGKMLKENARGSYCPTPIRKSPDGQTVIEWCKWKPGMTSAVKPLADITREDLPSGEKEPDWDAIRDEKNRFIARQVAYKGVIELRIAGLIKDNQVWETVKKHTEQLLEPADDGLEVPPPAEEAPPFAS